MKKLIKNIVLHPILLYLIFLIQIYVFDKLKIIGVAPNLIIIFVLISGITCGKPIGIYSGLLAGILYDLSFGKAFGVGSILFILTGYCAGWLFYSDKRMTIYLFCMYTFIGNFVYEICYIIVLLLMLNIDINFSVTKVIMLECIYNTIISGIIYLIIRNKLMAVTSI